MGDSYKVMALEVLKGQSRAEEARDVLTRVAKQVCECVGCLLGGGAGCVCGGRWKRDRSVGRPIDRWTLLLTHVRRPHHQHKTTGGAADGEVQVAGGPARRVLPQGD